MPLTCKQKRECTRKCMMNGSLSISEKGISPNIASHRKQKEKILVYRSKVFRWFLILFSSLQSRPNAYIDDLRYLKIKRSHHYYLTKGNGGVGKNLTIWQKCRCCCHCAYMVRTSKVANFLQYVERHFLTFFQSTISESTITRLNLIWVSYLD